ncbi:hypothetical protein D3C81_1913260 [compost metagenome]
MSSACMSSMSATIPRSAQKSSISWVSGMLPIIEPANVRRLVMRLNTPGDGCGVAGAPTSTIAPSRLRRTRNASRSCGAATVLMIRSKLLACLAISSALRDTTTSLAPSARAA